MRPVLIGVVAGVAVTAVVIAVRSSSQDTVYTMTAVQMGRTHHPKAWTGRRVLVQGRITIVYALRPHNGVVWWLPADCSVVSACLSDRQIQSLAPQGAALHLLLRPTGVRVPGSQPLLVLRPPPVDSAFCALSRLPLIAHLLPVPAGVRWGAGRVYRIQIFRTHSASCKPLECDDGQLLSVVR